MATQVVVTGFLMEGVSLSEKHVRRRRERRRVNTTHLWEKSCEECGSIFVPKEAARSLTAEFRLAELLGEPFIPGVNPFNGEPNPRRSEFKSVRKYCYSCSPSRKQRRRAPKKVQRKPKRKAKAISFSVTAADKEQENVEHWLYRMFDSEGRLLYVGISKDAFIRFHQHVKNKPWINEVARWEREKFPNRASVRKAEIEAIRLEKPKYNIAYNSEVNI